MTEQKIIQGDCLEVMKTMADKSFDLVLTDPPYYGREDLFGTERVAEAMEYIISRWNSVIFWPPRFNYPVREPDGEHIWHKSVPIHPNSVTGNVAGHHYERILVYGAGKECKVFRHAAIMPNFAAVADEFVEHPTQKPLSLISELIVKYSEEGDTILDPFLGSGTTAVACRILNRNFVGIEILPKYCDIAQKRLDAQALPMF